MNYGEVQAAIERGRLGDLEKGDIASWQHLINSPGWNSFCACLQKRLAVLTQSLYTETDHLQLLKMQGEVTAYNNALAIPEAMIATLQHEMRLEAGNESSGTDSDTQL